MPNTLFAVSVGVVNDRMLKAAASRRHAAGFDAATTFLLAAALLDRLSPSGLVLFAVLLQGVARPAGNAQMTLIRLTEPEGRPSDATAPASAVHAVVTTVGPAGAGFMLLHLGHAGVMAACAGPLAPTILRTVPPRPGKVPEPPQPLLPSLAVEWRVLRANRELCAMTVVSCSPTPPGSLRDGPHPRVRKRRAR